MRSALAAFATSIATHSSFVWQVLVGNMDPVVFSLRQTGLGGLMFVAGMAEPVALEGAFVCASEAPDPITNAATIQSFIAAIPYHFGQ